MAVADSIDFQLVIKIDNALAEFKKVLDGFETLGLNTGKDTGKNVVNSINNEAGGLKIGEFIKANIISGFVVDGIKGLVGGLSNTIKDGFGSALSFEVQISSIKALTGATTEELGKIKATSLQLGKDTKFSALEAAQGFEELLKAGLNLDTVINGGLAGALDLAAAGELSVAEAAEIASTALNTFSRDNLTVSKAADILAGAANASATDVATLKFSLSSVGNVAALAGQSFKDTATALALFANKGLKGSDAGTSLKTFLNNLIPTTQRAGAKFDELGLSVKGVGNKFLNANGSFKSLRDISEELKKATTGLSDSQKSLALETIFGSDAIRAGAILAGAGAEEFDKLANAIDKVTAKEVAKERLNNLSGSLETLKGTIETISIENLSGFLPILGKVTDSFNKFISGVDFTKISKPLQDFASNAVDSLLKIDFGSVISGFTNSFSKIDFAPIISRFTNFFGKINFGDIANSLGSLGNSFISLLNKLNNNQFNNQVFQIITDSIANFINFLPSVIDLVSRFVNSIVEINLSDITNNLTQLYNIAIKPLVDFLLQNGAVFNIFSNIFTVISSNINTLLPFILALGVQFSFLAVQIGIAIGYIITNLYPVFVGIASAVSDLLIALNPLLNFFGSLLGASINILLGVVQLVFPIVIGILVNFAVGVGNIIKGVIGIFTGFVNIVTGLFTLDLGRIINGVGQIFSGLKDVISGALTYVFAFVRGTFDGISNFIQAINLYQIGANMIQGLINGIRNNIGGVVSAITGGISGAVDSVKKYLGINSPSRLFMEIGGFTGEGLIIGLEKIMPAVAKAFDDLVNIPEMPTIPSGFSQAGNFTNSYNNKSQTNINNQNTNNSNNRSTTNQNFGNNYQLFPVNQLSF